MGTPLLKKKITKFHLLTQIPLWIILFWRGGWDLPEVFNEILHAINQISLLQRPNPAFQSGMHVFYDNLNDRLSLRHVILCLKCIS